MFVGPLVYGILFPEFCVVDIYVPLCPETLFFSRYFIIKCYGFMFFLLSSSMNDISFSPVPFQIMKISSMYARNKSALSVMRGFASNCAIKILTYAGAQIVPIASPITFR